MNSFDYTIVARNGYYYAILNGGEVIGAYLTVGALIADMRSIAERKSLFVAACVPGKDTLFLRFELTNRIPDSNSESVQALHRTVD